MNLCFRKFKLQWFNRRNEAFSLITRAKKSFDSILIPCIITRKYVLCFVIRKKWRSVLIILFIIPIHYLSQHFSGLFTNLTIYQLPRFLWGFAAFFKFKSKNAANFKNEWCIFLMIPGGKIRYRCPHVY